MPDAKNNFRVLIVEDEEFKSERLHHLFSEYLEKASIPEFEVVSAHTAEQARKLLDAALQPGLAFDVCVLDMKLSDRQGDPPTLNESLFRQLRASGQESVVIHTTAYPDDPKLMSYILDEAMRSPVGPRSVFVPLVKPDWPEEVTEIVRQVATQRSAARPPAQARDDFRSCFISYAHQDEAFVAKLYSGLKANGLEAWYAPEAMKPGRKIHEEIEHAIKVYDKFLLVLSEHSMRSQWVTTEVRTAFEEERNSGRHKLIPIRLVNYDKIRQWKCFDSDQGKDLATELREYFIPNFRSWRQESRYQAALGRLLDGLKTP